MSKSPDTKSIMIPAVGGAALVLGVAYGLATTNYGKDRIETLEASFAAERAAVSEQAARVTDLEAALAELQASSETQLSEAQAAAESQIATLSAQLEAVKAAAGAAAENLPAVTAAAASTQARTGGFGLGREAHPEELAAWDVDVLPDGRGLPVGSGDVWTGDEVFSEKCASCHGDFAEGRDAWPVLAGGFDTLDDRDPVKTVGSYWPYLSTVWDYVHRSMPFGNAGTLTDDEVYAITAYILYSNNLVEDDFTLSNENFTEVEMYNTDGFIVDDRPAVEYTMWSGEPCMENCKDGPVEITRRSTEVGVTPADDGSMAESFMEEQLARLGGTEWGKERVAGSVFMGPGGVMQDEPVEAEESAGTEVASADGAAPAAEADAASDAGPDPQLVAMGENVFRKCSSCHQVGDGARNRSGPQLNGVVGRAVGGLDGFRYSGAFETAHDEGMVWNDETLAGFLEDPRGYLEGTKMSFRGLNDPAEVEAIIAYLKSFDG
ncbi:c-type cytochrome [Alphaproteobacteria bacterium GH1-50]|uniref:C-type cytochrome n=1 Tax=Kangsaoukella pontilimi TaxID=2691042 RepID=A0A7C9IFC5_9RHOB|nr:c-type cytochrome [Kangsaoukella pontilimi]MXQ07464.1 c-type cytochrome [Kangsaoukella pontilimi]